MTVQLTAHTRTQEFSNNRSVAERISISEAAIAQILPQLNAARGEFTGIGYWQSGNVWCVSSSAATVSRLLY